MYPDIWRNKKYILWHSGADFFHFLSTLFIIISNEMVSVWIYKAVASRLVDAIILNHALSGEV